MFRFKKAQGRERWRKLSVRKIVTINNKIIDFVEIVFPSSNVLKLIYKMGQK